MKFIIIILLLLSYNQTLYSDDFNKLFGKEYFDYQARLQIDPKSILDDLLQSPKSNEAVKDSFNNLVISQAYYALVYPDKALEYANLGLKNLSETEHSVLYHRLQLAKSMAFDISGLSEKGLKGAKNALDWAEKNQQNNLNIESLTTLGYLYLSLGEYVPSLKSLQKAYNMAKSNDNFPHQEIAGIIALVYEYRREDELAVPFFIEVSDFHRKNKNWLELSIALYGLGRAHLRLGKIELGIKELQESAELSVMVEDYQGEGYALKELAGYAISMNDLEQAESMLIKSLNAFELANNKLMLFDANKVLCQLKLKTNEVDKAQEYLEKAMTYIDKDNQPSQYLEIQKQATDILATRGSYEKAFNDLRTIISQEKRLITKQSTEQLHQLRSQFELENKDKQNLILSQEVELKNAKLFVQNQKNQVLQIFIIFTITVIGLLIFIAYRLRKNKQHYENLANYDGLTGVFTRSNTLLLLKKAFLKSKENNLQMFVAMIDLDYFKNINDQFGHTTGDLVLKELGRNLTKLLDDKDICGRFGGEEFVIGLIDLNLENAYNKLELIRCETEIIYKALNNDKLRVTLSIGFCNNKNHKDIYEMIKSADDALYQAKENGRNQVIYSKD